MKTFGNVSYIHTNPNPRHMFPGTRILNATKTALGACLKEFREEGEFQTLRKSFQFRCYLSIPHSNKKRMKIKKNPPVSNAHRNTYLSRGNFWNKMAAVFEVLGKNQVFRIKND